MMQWPKEWDFQNEDVPFFLATPKSMVLYEPRLGKTVVTSKVLALDPETRTVLIACSKNAFGTWMDHIPAAFAKYCPHRTVEIRLIRGKGSNAVRMRQEIWLRKRRADVTVYICTFNALVNDYPFLKKFSARFDTVIGDEVHTKLKNRKNKSAIIFRDFVKRARRFHPLSGTLVGKWGPGDYWTLLNMCDPKAFPSFWEYVNHFCIMEHNGFGTEITGVQNVEQFRAMMAKYSRLRRRAVVRPQMPKTVRTLRWVERTPEQARLYDTLEAEKLVFTSDNRLIVAANSLEETMRRRQILVCPAILDPNLGVGGAMEDIIDILKEARENGDAESQHIVIFSAFRRALGPWEAALRAEGFTNVWQLVGGTEPEDVKRIAAAFKETNGIILCTTKFAQAFSLSSSRVCYHIGYEYDPNANMQAEDRLVPPEGDYTINSIYYGYRDTSDEFLAEDIVLKGKLIEHTYQAQM